MPKHDMTWYVLLQFMNGLLDDVYAVHHLCLRDDQRRSKPEYSVLNIKRRT